MVARPRLLRHVIYDAWVRRVVSVCLGALACLLVIGMAHVQAQEETTTTTEPTTPTTEEPVTVPSTTATTQATTTTQRAATPTTAGGGSPIPPPAAGPTQTLVPDLLGTPLDVQTTTTAGLFAPPSTVVTGTESASRIASSSDSPSGMMLTLAGLAWVASFGGLLVYAEERRASRWKHLAR